MGRAFRVRSPRGGMALANSYLDSRIRFSVVLKRARLFRRGRDSDEYCDPKRENAAICEDVLCSRVCSGKILGKEV